MKSDDKAAQNSLRRARQCVFPPVAMEEATDEGYNHRLVQKHPFGQALVVFLVRCVFQGQMEGRRDVAYAVALLQQLCNHSASV